MLLVNRGCRLRKGVPRSFPRSGTVRATVARSPTRLSGPSLRLRSSITTRPLARLRAKMTSSGNSPRRIEAVGPAASEGPSTAMSTREPAGGGLTSNVARHWLTVS